jgi:hypothetical protein
VGVLPSSFRHRRICGSRASAGLHRDIRIVSLHGRPEDSRDRSSCRTRGSAIRYS